MNINEIEKLKQLIKEAVEEYQTSSNLKSNYQYILRETSEAVGIPPYFLERIAAPFVEIGDTQTVAYICNLYINAQYGYRIKKAQEFLGKEREFFTVNETETPVRNTNSFVYLATSKSTPGIYKIGKSNDLTVRESSLRCGNIYLDIVANSELLSEEEAYKLESKLHRLFNHLNVDREWFKLGLNELETLKYDYNFRWQIY